MKISDKTKKWLKAAAVRTVKTMAETAVALIGTNTMGITDVDWLGVLSACALSGVVTILTCIKGLPEVKIDN
jgi:L-fucose isomerase-like protein